MTEVKILLAKGNANLDQYLEEEPVEKLIDNGLAVHEGLRDLIREQTGPLKAELDNIWSNGDPQRYGVKSGISGRYDENKRWIGDPVPKDVKINQLDKKFLDLESEPLTLPVYIEPATGVASYARLMK